MVERIEDLNLPASVVGRIIKEALPNGAILSKEARTTISHAASVFIIYLTTFSTKLAQEKKHKTLNANDVLETLPNLDFEEFVETINKDLERHRQTIRDKKETKAKPTVSGGNVEKKAETPKEGTDTVENAKASADDEEMVEVSTVEAGK